MVARRDLDEVPSLDIRQEWKKADEVVDHAGWGKGLSNGLRCGVSVWRSWHAGGTVKGSLHIIISISYLACLTFVSDSP